MPGEVMLLLHSAEAGELARYLQKEGYDVSQVVNEREPIDPARHGRAALLILDSVPAANGLGAIEILRRVRQQSLLPVLIVAEPENDAERILAFELGADDYLTKPYLPQELLARTRAILRRTQTGVIGIQHLVRAGEIELDRMKRRVSRAGAELLLTTAEFDLLEILMRHSGRVVSREEIAKVVLGRPLSFNDRSIDMHVSNLRRKLCGGQRGSGPIKAIRGIGYLFVQAT